VWSSAPPKARLRLLVSKTGGEDAGKLLSSVLK